MKKESARAVEFLSWLLDQNEKKRKTGKRKAAANTRDRRGRRNRRVATSISKGPTP